jgi:hypothetical protein
VFGSGQDAAALIDLVIYNNVTVHNCLCTGSACAAACGADFCARCGPGVTDYCYGTTSCGACRECIVEALFGPGACNGYTTSPYCTPGSAACGAITSCAQGCPP